MCNRYICEAILAFSLKHEILSKPKAKIWTTRTVTFTTKKKAMIAGCILHLTMTNHIFNMEVNIMPDSNQPYAVIMSRDLMYWQQLSPDIVESMIEWHTTTIMIVPYGYWNITIIDILHSGKTMKLNGD